MSSEKDEVWAQTTAGGLLHDLFGNFPTLHDARVHAIEIDRGADEAVMVVDYSDRVEEGPHHLCVRMRMTWTGLAEFNLHQRENHLYGMSVSSKAGLIVTEFEQAFGIHGRVVAQHFEVTLVQVDPPEEDDAHLMALTVR